MDLVDRIESTRFLGCEFLTWLWFKVELFDGTLELLDGRQVDLWIDTQLVLASLQTPTEKATLTGVSPSTAAEATAALQQGKVPLKAALRLVLAEHEFAFTLDGQRLAVSGVKLPELMEAESDERFFERMQLIEDLDGVLTELYEEFLALRLSPVWDADVGPAMQQWVKGRLTLSPAGYAGLLARVAQDRVSGKRKSRR